MLIMWHSADSPSDPLSSQGTRAVQETLVRQGKNVGRNQIMPQTSPRQRKTTGRVMHEFKHGELKSGRGGKVKSRRQAIAIALKEAGASKYESEDENRRNLAKSERKETRGETYEQEREGKSPVGARGRRESSRGMGGTDATSTTAKGRKAARARARHTGGATKQELYRRAKARGVEGRSKMSKAQLANAPPVGRPVNELQPAHEPRRHPT
jgi:hypothetical protein